MSDKVKGILLIFLIGSSIIYVINTSKKPKSRHAQHSIYGRYYLQTKMPGKTGDACDNCYMSLEPSVYGFPNQEGGFEIVLPNNIGIGYFTQVELNQTLKFVQRDGSSCFVKVDTTEDDWTLDYGSTIYKHENK